MVYRESTDPSFPVGGAKEVKTFDWIQTRTVNDLNLAQALSDALGAGEAEAIALAVEMQAAQVLIEALGVISLCLMEDLAWIAEDQANVAQLAMIGLRKVKPDFKITGNHAAGGEPRHSLLVASHLQLMHS
ncbi:MAG: hypothetical protein AAF289_10565 [Cyanobacteria bacterium P01_A01_bin.135]